MKIEALALVCTLPSPAFALQATLEFLPDPVGASVTTPHSANADGRVIVGWSSTTTGLRAFRFSDEYGTEPINSGLHNGGSIFERIAVSANGEIVTGTQQITGGYRSYRWTRATGAEILDVPGPGTISTVGGAVSADGRVVVGAAAVIPPMGSSAPFRLTRWDASNAPTTIDIPQGTTLSNYGTATSADGSVIAGTLFYSGASTEGFVWEEGIGTSFIGFLPAGALYSEALVVSANGSTVAGWAAFNATDYHPILWTQATGTVDLGDMGGVAYNPKPTGISGDGSVVVGSYRNVVNSRRRNFIWTQATGLMDLGDYLATVGIAIPSDALFTGYCAISEDGNCIAGSYSPTFNGTYRAFRVFLTPPDFVASTDYCSTQPLNSVGLAADMDVIGDTDVNLNYAILRAQGLPPMQFGMFLCSQAQSAGTTPVNSMGSYCLGAPQRAHLMSLMQSSALGSLEFVLDLGEFPQSAVVMSGDTWNFQCWYRDRNPGATSAFTEASTVTFQ